VGIGETGVDVAVDVGKGVDVAVAVDNSMGKVGETSGVGVSRKDMGVSVAARVGTSVGVPVGVGAGIKGKYNRCPI